MWKMSPGVNFTAAYAVEKKTSGHDTENIFKSRSGLHLLYAKRQRWTSPMSQEDEYIQPPKSDAYLCSNKSQTYVLKQLSLKSTTSSGYRVEIPHKPLLQQITKQC